MSCGLELLSYPTFQSAHREQGGGRLPSVNSLDPTVKRLVEHSDLEQRLSGIPVDAQVRGLYLKNVQKVLGRLGAAGDYHALYPETYSAIRWYPVRDYLERLAVAGALLRGSENLHQGVREIARSNATTFTESLLGRAMLLILARDPVRLLKQAMGGRRLSHNYGIWELFLPEPGKAIIEMKDEYQWMDSYLFGAAEGTFASTEPRVTITCELDSMYRGRHVFSWDPQERERTRGDKSASLAL